MFTWKAIFMELAEKLLDYRERQDQLLAWMKEMRNDALPVISLEDQDPKGQTVPLREIDPFTFFACFNRGISTSSRTEILRRIKGKMSLHSAAPEDFSGLPIVNNLKTWFFPYAFERAADDIDKLWDFAEQVVSRDPEKIDADLFGRCLKIRGIQLAKLTMGMFWLRPDRFFAVDHLNVTYLGEKGFSQKTLKSPKLTDYLANIRSVRDKLNFDFASLSHNAFLLATQLNLDVRELDLGFRNLLSQTADKNKRSLPDFVDCLINGAYESGENEITNRIKHLTTMGELLRAETIDLQALKSVSDQLCVLQGRMDLMRRSAYFDSGDVVEDVHALLDDTGRLDIKTRINEFIDAATEKGYKPKEGEDRSGPAQFASVLLSAYHPDQFVDFRTQRWNALYRAIYDTNRLLLSGADYGYQIVRAGSFASQLANTPTFQQFFGKQHALWKIAGVAWDFRNGVFLLETKPPIRPPIPTDEELPEVENVLPEATNLILYGPPGTGKTYRTMRHAVEMIDGEASTFPAELKKRFDHLMEQSRIGFVTFHQSYCYEDFVEGIRPVMSADNPSNGPRYECRDGIFKIMCNTARNRFIGTGTGKNINVANARFWKMSLGNTLRPEDAQIYEDCIEEGYIAHGFAPAVDFSGCQKPEDFRKKLAGRKSEDDGDELYGLNSLNRMINQMQAGDLVIISDGNSKFRAIGQLTGDYAYRPDLRYPHTRSVQWIRAFDESQPKERILKSKKFVQATLYRLKNEDLKLDAIRELLTPAQGKGPEDYVLIIDEINRGNISRIFGELITLIEADKREGQPNQLTVTLPYSQQKFVVPNNLHIIGTMNTADKSIALVDVALRRRFDFKELMPDFKLCSELPEELFKVLREMNRRIAVRKDRDHQIGHSYFISVSNREEFNETITRRVLPLLQEYFYNDWDGLRFVLGEEDSGSSRILVPIEGAQTKWARNRWQWYHDAGVQDLDLAAVLVENYGLKVKSDAQPKQ